MTDDLVTRLSETLDEVEGLAAAARALCWDPRGNCVIADDGNPATPLVAHVPNRGSRAHIARWDPQAVLRLVAAQRKIIAQHQPYRHIPWVGQPVEQRCRTCYEDGLINDEGEGGSVWVEFVGQTWPCATLASVAEGWGLSDG